MDNEQSDIIQIILDNPGNSSDIRDALAFIKSKVDAGKASEFSRTIFSYADEEGADSDISSGALNLRSSVGRTG